MLLRSLGPYVFESVAERLDREAEEAAQTTGATGDGVEERLDGEAGEARGEAGSGRGEGVELNGGGTDPLPLVRGAVGEDNRFSQGDDGDYCVVEAEGLHGSQQRGRTSGSMRADVAAAPLSRGAVPLNTDSSSSSLTSWMALSRRIRAWVTIWWPKRIK